MKDSLFLRRLRRMFFANYSTRFLGIPLPNGITLRISMGFRFRTITIGLEFGEWCMWLYILPFVYAYFDLADSDLIDAYSFDTDTIIAEYSNVIPFSVAGVSTIGDETLVDFESDETLSLEELFKDVEDVEPIDLTEHH